MNFRYSTYPHDKYGVKKPYLPIKYNYKGSFTPKIHTLIDSGADQNIFTSELADFFSIDWRNLKTDTHTGPDGSTFDVHIFDEPLTLDIEGNKLVINKVNFSPSLSVQLSFILGQDDFFDLCRITFERYKWNIDIRIQD